MAVTQRATVVHRIRLTGELHTFRFHTKTALPATGSAVFVSVDDVGGAQAEKNFSTFRIDTHTSHPGFQAFLIGWKAVRASAAMHLHVRAVAVLKRICQMAGRGAGARRWAIHRTAPWPGGGCGRRRRRRLGARWWCGRGPRPAGRRAATGVRTAPRAWRSATVPRAAWPPRCGRCAGASCRSLPGPRIRTSRQSLRERCL